MSLAARTTKNAGKLSLLAPLARQYRLAKAFGWQCELVEHAKKHLSTVKLIQIKGLEQVF
ncbi:MAG: hypothetical protein V4463_10810 [Pseudomonadota bacterium]